MYYIYKYIENNEIVYIGQSTNLLSRVQGHKYDKLQNFTGDIYYTILSTEFEMDFLENVLINVYHPKYNDKNKFNNIELKIQDNFVWYKYREEDFKIKDKQKLKDRYLKQKNYKNQEELQSRGRKRKEVSIKDFIFVNAAYEQGEIDAQEACKQLNIARTTFYKLRRSAEEYFGVPIPIRKPKRGGKKNNAQ